MTARSSSAASSSSASSAASASASPRAKRPRLARLALPESLGGASPAQGDEAQGDAARHDGRTRRVPHVEGNYATLVYLPVPPTEAWRRGAEACAAALRRLAHPAAAGPQGAGASEAKVHLTDAASGPGFHVSLGAPLTLRRQFIGPLLGRLRQLAARGAPGPAVLFDEEIEVLTSADRARFFAGVVVAEASASRLRPIVSDVLRAARELGLLQLAPPAESVRLHCSLAWTLADVEPGLAAAAAASAAERRQSAWGVSWRLQGPEDIAGLLRVPARELRALVGDRVTMIPLPRPAGLAALNDEDEDDEATEERGGYEQ